jgi:hypothetical protein
MDRIRFRLRIDRENPMLGRYSACRRVARTLYLGSAPMQDAANKGLDDRQVKFGCVQPGETSGTFGDALRKLADQATYLYVNEGRYWYSTQPSVNRMAEERAERFHPEDVTEEIRRRLLEEAKHRGDFSKGASLSCELQRSGGRARSEVGDRRA